MRVRLIKTWAGRPPGHYVSVSDERAVYMMKNGICEDMEEPKNAAPKPVQKQDPKKENAASKKYQRREKRDA